MPKKRKSSRRTHRHKSKRKHKSHSKGCHYCGKNVFGIAHTCKYCGEKHCDGHILPEEHNCKGLKKNFEWKAPKKRRFESHSNHSSSRKSQKFTRTHRPRRRKIRIRAPKTNTFVKSLIVAVITLTLAYNYPQYSLLLWIEAISWVCFSYILFRRVFRWANRVSMSDDLAFFGLRILGAVITVIGVIFFFVTSLATSFSPGSAPLNIPIYSIITGLIILGAFIAFRTNRRHNVVGIWGA